MNELSWFAGNRALLLQVPTAVNIFLAILSHRYILYTKDNGSYSFSACLPTALSVVWARTLSA